MKRAMAGLLAASLALTMAGCGEGRRFASLGTAGTGGIYYPLGGAIARMLGEALPDISFTAEVTGGSVENLNRVASGEMDLGMAIGTTLAHARDGDESARYAEIRVVAPLYANFAHLLVSPGSGVAELADARGRRISIGAAGSGTEEMARELLAAHGLGIDDVNARYLSFTESSDALRDGAIDVAILSVGFPASAVLEATTTAGIRLIGIQEGPLARLLDEYRWYRRGQIPAGVYPGIESDLPTATVMNWVIAEASLPDAIAIALLDALANRRAELAAVSDIATRIELDALASAPLPLHPASERWLAERATAGAR